MKDHRQTKRVKARLDAKVLVLLPEETFRPEEADGYTADISERGMMIYLPGMNEEYYKKLLTQQRWAKVFLPPPQLVEMGPLIGKIVWIDYDNRGDLPICKMGIFFDSANEEEKKALSQLVRVVADSEEKKR
jgi:hypothetical protein